ncbi:hypothetical protein A2U01_0107494, partial [Trifolium medium]|nr:hypothetical protein [Trifolium medium]
QYGAHFGCHNRAQEVWSKRHEGPEANKQAIEAHKWQKQGHDTLPQKRNVQLLFVSWYAKI